MTLVFLRLRTPSIAWMLCLLATSACSESAKPDAGSCAAESRCGGDPTGTWAIDSECLTIDSPFRQPECQSAIQNVSVVVSGTVTYSAGTQASVVSSKLDATERYTEACLKALGFDGASPDACHGLELLWAGKVSVTCSPSRGACACDFADAASATDAVDFAVEGNQVVLSGMERLDFCQSGDHLVETATTDSSRAVLTLHRVSP